MNTPHNITTTNMIVLDTRGKSPIYNILIMLYTAYG